MFQIRKTGVPVQPTSTAKIKSVADSFRAHIEKIPYLKELGINCIELMPIFEFDEFENARESDGVLRLNYWGYSTVGFFAPKAGYAASAPYGMRVWFQKEMQRNCRMQRYYCSCSLQNQGGSFFP